MSHFKGVIRKKRVTSIINNSFQHNSFICSQLNGFKSQLNGFKSQLNGFKYNWWLNSFIWPTDGTSIGTTALGQSGPGSNGNEEVQHILQSSRTGTLSTDGLRSYTRLEWRFCIGAVSVFNTPNRTWLYLCIFVVISIYKSNLSIYLSIYLQWVIQ